MAFNPDDYIQPMTFVYVNTDKFEKEEGGIKAGDVMFVIGTRALPTSEEDPYTQRVFALVQPVIDGYIDTTSKVFIVDPLSVTNLAPEEQERLMTLAQERAQATLH